MADFPYAFGKYEIRGELGRGGFATVYRAFDTVLGREVALKVLAPHLCWDQAFVERFQQEARVAAQLNHDSIITIYDVGDEDGQYYIAMELVSGGSLRDRLQDSPPLSIEETVALLLDVADALDYAHQQGLIHRDIKPSNILLKPGRHDDERAVLTDFGLVKALAVSAELTTSGTVVGTVEYMAPEQADADRNGEIGPATDIYALGIVAYQMLTGQVPFTGSTVQVLMAHVSKEPSPPDTIRQDLPAGVSEAILRALAKQPQDRYATATAFVQALQAASRPRPPQPPATQPPVETPPAEIAPALPLTPAPIPETERVASPPAAEESSAAGRKRSRKIVTIVGAVVILLALLCYTLVWIDNQSGDDSVPTIIGFQAEPAVITRGQTPTIRLSWQVENVDAIEITPDVGDIPAEGNSIEVSAPEETREYTLVAYNAAGSSKAQVLVEVLEPGDRQDNWVNIIELSPSSPAEVGAGQPVRVQFEYGTVEPEGVRIFVRPFSGEDLSPGYRAPGSPLYGPDGGVREIEFTVTRGPVTVDRLRIQMLSADQSRLLFEQFVSVTYDFVGE